MTAIKCGYCDGVITYDPYTEILDGQVTNFHAKAWADALKASKFARWAYCGGQVAYKPYTETINGKVTSFHARACADAFKKAGMKQAVMV